MARFVGNLQVKCVNKNIQSECSWTGDLRDLQVILISLIFVNMFIQIFGCYGGCNSGYFKNYNLVRESKVIFGLL